MCETCIDSERKMKSLKTWIVLCCVLSVFEFSAEEKSHADFEAELQLESSESEEEKKLELLSAVQKVDTKAILRLIEEGALEEYHPTINDSIEKKKLEKILNKVKVVQLLLKMGVVAVPSEHYLEYNSTDEKLFNVTLIQGTDLVMTLLINVSVVKTWTDEMLIKSGKIPLFMICALPDVSPETVRVVLEAGTVNVDIQGDSNITALMIASSRGNLDVVKFLVENGANVNNTAFMTFESVGILGDRFRFLKLFSSKNISVPPTVIHTSALVAAVYEGHPHILEYLIKCGADVNVMDQGWTALNNAVSTGKMDMLKILLQGGIDVNSKDIMGATALHTVAKNNDTESAKLLLHYGANVNATDYFGWTPLHVAAFFSRNASKAMIELLLAFGGDVNATTDDEFSPLNLVEAGQNIYFLEYLMKNHDILNSAIDHVEIQEMDSNEEHAEVVRFLLNQGADLDHQDNLLGWTILHWATSSGDLRVTKMLIEEFGAVMTGSKLGMTPFGTAKHFGMKSVVEYFSTARNLV
nr:putative ankyrin repeat protein RF_0381 isoform X1 [Halyomorpha halys]